jgi:hypothetical protein
LEVHSVPMAEGKWYGFQDFGPDAAVCDSISEYSPLKRIIIRILKSVNYILIINYNC